MMMMSSSGGVDTSSLLPSLQKASKNWKSFDWDNKASQWNEALETSKQSREAAQVARKQLAETTKTFKKSVKGIETAGTSLGPNEETTAKAIEQLAKLARVTVKSYQEEIDNLTRRSKQTETVFTALTAALSSVPDPAALLASSVESVAVQQQQLQDMAQRMESMAKENEKLQKQVKQQQNQAPSSSSSTGFSSAKEEELIQLRREVAEYEVEFRSLKNQDITIRKLESRIAELQAGGETELNEKVEAAKQELIETEGRRTAEALEREAAMERQVASLALQLKAERAGRAATNAHLLEASEGAGEREAAWEAQRQILIDDAERVRLSLHEATRERDELRLKVAALDGTSGGVVPAPSSGGMPMADLLTERKAYEAEVAELSSTISALREEMAMKDSGVDNDRRTNKLRVDSLEREILKLKTEMQELAIQLEAAPSQSLVDSMKRELRILKRLEYNAEDADEPERDPEIAGRNEDQEKDLESVLVAKLRRVESELVRERNNVSQMKSDVETLENTMKEMQKSKAESEATIATLERDLDRAISSSTASSTPKSGQKKSGSEPVLAPSDPNALQSVLDPDFVPPPEDAPKSSNTDTTAKASAADKAADDHSVATIIMAQRDRLRARCDALEAERDSFKRELQAQVDAAESLQADNTKLFEKMRYLQSYNSGASSRAVTYSRSASMGSNRDLDLEALEARYEQSVDPFRQFSKAERQRKLQEMSPMERAVFVVAKVMLGTKEMRTFLFFYICAMHFLVFLTTYHWSHSDDCALQNELHHEQLSHLPPVDSRLAITDAAEVATG
mmetsp:Transcript_34105/g.82029  ORF Transcript_34105/g.82029 Transcript_34105/m.82029 type:complete len:799 (-) Transcript_34105:98-2494(-)